MTSNSEHDLEMSQKAVEMVALEISDLKKRSERLAQKLNKYIQANGSSQELKDKCKVLFKKKKS